MPVSASHATIASARGWDRLRRHAVRSDDERRDADRRTTDGQPSKRAPTPTPVCVSIQKNPFDGHACAMHADADT
jgi:hypothetical protein